MKQQRTAMFCLRVIPPAVLALAGVLEGAWAAGTTPGYDSGEALRGAARPNVAPARVTPPPAPVIQQDTEGTMTMHSGQTLYIRDFVVEDADFLAASDVHEALASYRNRNLTLAQLQEAAARITALCRVSGYLVARAYLPKQDARDGVVRIKVVVGRYGKFGLDNTTKTTDSVLLGVLARVSKNASSIHQDGLEQALLQLSDLPGVGLPKLNIMPGDEPGTSDFLLSFPDARAYSGYVMADNYGSRYTGGDRLNMGLDLNSPFGLGDKLTLSGMDTTNGGLWNARAGYSMPLGSSGLRAEVAASHTSYQLGSIYTDLQASGDADIVEANFSFPLVRSQLNTVLLSLNAADKTLNDRIVAAGSLLDKRVQSLTFGIRQERYVQWGDLPGFYSMGSSVTAGHLAIGDPASLAQNKAGANTVGDYAKMNAEATGSVNLSSKWLLNGSVRAQQSLGKNLDGSEQLSVSGAGVIKSYPDGAAGDNGYLVRAEVQYALPSLDSSLGALTQSVGTFADYGVVRPQNGAYTTVGDVEISDAGLSYSVSSRDWFGRLDAVQTLGKSTQTLAYNNDFKLLLQIGMRF